MALTLSPNMNLTIPGVGTESGPAWATDLNTSLSILDQHNHTPGSGVQITPAAININSALSLNNNFAIATAGMTFTAQNSPPANNTVYEAGVDLYYVDGLGNNVQITANGGVAGSPGSISNLTSPASAAYVAGSKTFVWQSDVGIAANLDAGSILLRNLSPNSTHAITLQAPASLPSNYNVVLPALPASTSLMALDSSGNISAPYSIAGGLNASVLTAGSVTATQIASKTVTAALIADATITTTQIASQTIAQGNLALRATGTTVAAGGVARASSSGSYTTTSASFQTVSNQTITITTTGRPVKLGLMSTSTSTGNLGQLTTGYAQEVQFLRDGTTSVGAYRWTQSDPGSANPLLPCSAVSAIDFVAAGTYTYQFQIRSTVGGGQVKASNVQLIVYEL